MTHAEKSHDAFEALQAISEQLRKASADAEAIMNRLQAERLEMDNRLALANAVAILSKLEHQSTVTSGDKSQIRGVIGQLKAVAG